MAIKKNFTLILAVCLALQAFAQDVTIGNTTLVSRDIATGLDVPWEVLWGPDDHLWVTERRGNVLRIDPETGNTQKVLDYVSNVRSVSEAGMLGMALHPDFDNFPYIYLAYTYGAGPNIFERISRFTWNGVDQLTDEMILMEGISAGYIHSGARLVITDDLKLLVTLGDYGASYIAQDMTSLSGKLIRMELDGSIPADNPIPNSYIYSYGHRNAQGLHIASNGILYSSEHGPSNSDEVNIIEPNRNYGWPEVEGACNTTYEIDFCNQYNVKEPIIEFSPCLAVNDLIYYDHPAIPEFQNSLLMAVLGGFATNASQIMHLPLNADGTEVLDQASYFTNFGRLRDICVNPYTGAIIFATNGSGYPSFGPNRLVEYSNPEYVSNENLSFDSEKNFIHVYPNPSASVADIKFVVSEQFLGETYQVFSFDGSTVETGRVNAVNLQLKATQLPSGSYFIEIKNELGAVTRVFSVK